MILPAASHPWSNRGTCEGHNGRTNTRFRDRIQSEHLELENQQNELNEGSRESVCAVIPGLKRTGQSACEKEGVDGIKANIRHLKKKKKLNYQIYWFNEIMSYQDQQYCFL